MLLAVQVLWLIENQSLHVDLSPFFNSWISGSFKVPQRKREFLGWCRAIYLIESDGINNKSQHIDITRIFNELQQRLSLNRTSHRIIQKPFNNTTDGSLQRATLRSDSIKFSRKQKNQERSY